MTGFYRIHGLTIASPFSLGHRALTASPVDMEVTVANALSDDYAGDEDPGRMVASDGNDRLRFALYDRGERGLLVRFHHWLDVEISPDQRILSCRLVKGRDPAILPMFVPGAVLAGLMLMRGWCVLHASAVERDGVAVALIGASGAGKSTLSALACMGGAALVADDVLRVDVEGAPTCYRGSAELRLRPGVSPVTCLDAATPRSFDDRYLWAPRPTDLDRLRLGSLILPTLLPPGHPITLTRLDPRAALLAVLGCPRMPNWADRDTQAAHFGALAALVEQVPAYRLDAPRGIPATDHWTKRLAELLAGAAYDSGPM